MSYQGLDVPRGVSAMIGITSEEIRRLPYPYTNCSSDNREKQLLVEAIQVIYFIVQSTENSGQKKKNKVNGTEGAKYFSNDERVNIFWHLNFLFFLTTVHVNFSMPHAHGKTGGNYR